MNSWMFYLILAAIPGVIVFAVVAKYLEILQVRRWPGAPGRIVASASQAREVSRGDRTTPSCAASPGSNTNIPSPAGPTAARG